MGLSPKTNIGLIFYDNCIHAKLLETGGYWRDFLWHLYVSFNTWSSSHSLQWGRIYVPPRFNKNYPKRWPLCMCFSYGTIHHVVQAHFRICLLFTFPIITSSPTRVLTTSPTPLLDWVVERVTCWIDLILNVYCEDEFTT